VGPLFAGCAVLLLSSWTLGDLFGFWGLFDTVAVRDSCLHWKAPLLEGGLLHDYMLTILPDPRHKGYLLLYATSWCLRAAKAFGLRQQSSLGQVESCAIQLHTHLLCESAHIEIPCHLTMKTIKTRTTTTGHHFFPFLYLVC